MNWFKDGMYYVNELKMNCLKMVYNINELINELV